MSGFEPQSATDAPDVEPRRRRARLEDAWIIRVRDLPLQGGLVETVKLTRSDPVSSRPLETLYGLLVESGRREKTITFVVDSVPPIRLKAVLQPRGGGTKWMFVCGATGGLCHTLVRLPGAAGFISRAAAGPLSYASQRRSPRRRAADRAAAIRVELRGSADISAPFPPKPPGMRSSSYTRLRAEAEAAAAIALAGRRPLANLHHQETQP